MCSHFNLSATVARYKRKRAAVLSAMSILLFFPEHFATSVVATGAGVYKYCSRVGGMGPHAELAQWLGWPLVRHTEFAERL